MLKKKRLVVLDVISKHVPSEFQAVPLPKRARSGSMRSSQRLSLKPNEDNPSPSPMLQISIYK